MALIEQKISTLPPVILYLVAYIYGRRYVHENVSLNEVVLWRSWKINIIFLEVDNCEKIVKIKVLKKFHEEGNE